MLKQEKQRNLGVESPDVRVTTVVPTSPRAAVVVASPSNHPEKHTRDIHEVGFKLGVLYLGRNVFGAQTQCRV